MVIVMVQVPWALMIVCGHPPCGAAALATHQALKGSGQTTMMTTGTKPYCETVNLPAP
jgi:carbonic anhydrase